MNQRDTIFTALMGSTIIEKVPDLNLIQNELAKQVLPPIPFLPFKNEIGIRPPGQVAQYENNWRAQTAIPEAQQFFPFSFEVDGQRYLLPYEPIVNINGKNIIVRRNVAKANGLIGSVKERWAQDDYEITITGVLMGSILTGSVADCFPRSDFERLRDIMTRPEALTVYCEPLQLLGISKIVIEDFTFPFTKGENIQAYTIKAYSDFAYSLLIEENE